jgi:hypothetical protein
VSLGPFELLYRQVNGRAELGDVGVRDPNGPCEFFDGNGYDGRGDCLSDGHYLCVECSHLSAHALRFTETNEGKGERLRLFWRRRRP